MGDTKRALLRTSRTIQEAEMHPTKRAGVVAFAIVVLFSSCMTVELVSDSEMPVMMYGAPEA